LKIETPVGESRLAHEERHSTITACVKKNAASSQRVRVSLSVSNNREGGSSHGAALISRKNTKGRDGRRYQKARVEKCLAGKEKTKLF